MMRFSTVFAKAKDKDDERSINQALAAATKNINDLASAVVNDMVGRFTVQYGLNWPAALAANLGYNWITVFQAALGANWAQALAADAQDGATNGLDAKTVKGSGIGTLSPSLGATFAAAFVGGEYTYGATTTSAPTTAAGHVFVSENAATDEFIAIDGATHFVYQGYRAHGTGAPTWKILWSPSSDGNGGQPPAPRPTSGTPAGGADAPGQYYSGGVSNASIYNAGSVSKATGQWEFSCTTFVSATGVIVAAKTINRIGNGYDGFSVSASETCVYDARRIS
jgi:hypothetical protein